LLFKVIHSVRNSQFVRLSWLLIVYFWLQFITIYEHKGHKIKQRWTLQISSEVHSFVRKSVILQMIYLVLLLLFTASVVLYRIIKYIKTPTINPIEEELNRIRKKEQYTRVVLVAGLLYHDYQQALSEGFITHISHFRLCRESTPNDDPLAVSIYCGRFKIGFVPTRFSEEIANELDASQTIKISLQGHYPHKIIFEQLEVKLINETRKSILALSA
jgi:hypothetical protein